MLLGLMSLMLGITVPVRDRTDPYPSERRCVRVDVIMGPPGVASSSSLATLVLIPIATENEIE
jgi:hypothetical protein